MFSADLFSRTRFVGEDYVCKYNYSSRHFVLWHTPCTNWISGRLINLTHDLEILGSIEDG